jgi:hypothetical protein
MRKARQAALIRYMRNAYTVSVGKPEGKKQLGKSRRRGTA